MQCLQSFCLRQESKDLYNMPPLIPECLEEHLLRKPLKVLATVHVLTFVLSCTK